MAKSDRPTRQRSWPLLYSISFLKPRLWVSLAGCCNFFHIPQLQSNSYIVTCRERGGGPSGACRRPQSGTHQTHAPLFVLLPESSEYGPGYRTLFGRRRGYVHHNLYSKWMQPHLWSRRVSMCVLVKSDLFHYSIHRTQNSLIGCVKTAGWNLIL